MTAFSPAGSVASGSECPPDIHSTPSVSLRYSRREPLRAIRECYTVAIFARVLKSKLSDTSSLDYPPLRYVPMKTIRTSILHFAFCIYASAYRPNGLNLNYSLFTIHHSSITITALLCIALELIFPENQRKKARAKKTLAFHYLIKSLIISPAMIRPTTLGTNDTLPGVLSPLGLIGGSSENTTFR